MNEQNNAGQQPAANDCGFVRALVQVSVENGVAKIVFGGTGIDMFYVENLARAGFEALRDKRAAESSP